MAKMNYNNFIDDEEKVNDMFYLSKEEFLKTYSYLTDKEYENTVKKIKRLIEVKIKTYEKQNKARNENIEESRRRYNEYYQKNKKTINARRKSKYQVRKLTEK